MIRSILLYSLKGEIFLDKSVRHTYSTTSTDITPKKNMLEYHFFIFVSTSSTAYRSEKIRRYHGTRRDDKKRKRKKKERWYAFSLGVKGWRFSFPDSHSGGTSSYVRTTVGLAEQLTSARHVEGWDRESGAARKKCQKTKKGTVGLMWRRAYLMQVEPRDDWLEFSWIFQSQKLVCIVLVPVKNLWINLFNIYRIKKLLLIIIK